MVLMSVATFAGWGIVVQPCDEEVESLLRADFTILIHPRTPHT
jgi:hypothetical protein